MRDESAAAVVAAESLADGSDQPPPPPGALAPTWSAAADRVGASTDGGAKKPKK